MAGEGSAPKKKLVVVVDGALPAWQALNTVAFLSLSVGGGARVPIGPELPDGSGGLHAGVATVTVPILAATAAELGSMWREASETEGVLAVDFNGAAHASKSYDEYASRLARARTGELTYLGVALWGDRKKVDRLTGNLKLYR